MYNLKDFKGKIITVGRKNHHDNTIFPDLIKEIGYVDDNLFINYVCGICVDNSPYFIGGISGELTHDVEENYDIEYIRETNEQELKIYIKDCEKFFNSVLKEKGRPPIGRFPLPIIDKFYIDDFWKEVLIKEQKK